MIFISQGYNLGFMGFKPEQIKIEEEANKYYDTAVNTLTEVLFKNNDRLQLVASSVLTALKLNIKVEKMTETLRPVTYADLYGAIVLTDLLTSKREGGRLDFATLCAIWARENGYTPGSFQITASRAHMDTDLDKGQDWAIGFGQKHKDNFAFSLYGLDFTPAELEKYWKISGMFPWWLQVMIHQRNLNRMRGTITHLTKTFSTESYRMSNVTPTTETFRPYFLLGQPGVRKASVKFIRNNTTQNFVREADEVLKDLLNLNTDDILLAGPSITNYTDEFFNRMFAIKDFQQYVAGVRITKKSADVKYPKALKKTDWDAYSNFVKDLVKVDSETAAGVFHDRSALTGLLITGKPLKRSVMPLQIKIEWKKFN